MTVIERVRASAASRYRIPLTPSGRRWIGLPRGSLGSLFESLEVAVD
jgi:hypothetical protein